MVQGGESSTLSVGGGSGPSRGPHRPGAEFALVAHLAEPLWITRPIEVKKKVDPSPGIDSTRTVMPLSGYSVAVIEAVMLG